MYTFTNKSSKARYVEALKTNYSTPKRVLPKIFVLLFVFCVLVINSYSQWTTSVPGGTPPFVYPPSIYEITNTVGIGRNVGGAAGTPYLNTDYPMLLVHSSVADGLNSRSIIRLQTVDGLNNLNQSAKFGKSELQFWSGEYRSWEWEVGKILSVTNLPSSTDFKNNTTQAGGGLAFFSKPNNTLVNNSNPTIETMRIIDDKVGIGTTKPQGKLDINVGYWNCGLGKVSFDVQGPHNYPSWVPQMRMYCPNGAYVGYDCDNYPASAWYLTQEYGNIRFQNTNTDAPIGSETVDTKVSFMRDGNVGINNTTPTAKLQVTDGSVLYNGTVGSTPISGSGTRMMWVPGKAAFRAGAISGTEWDATNIGDYSAAFGQDNKAMGMFDFAMGLSNEANSTTMVNPADRHGSVAIGHGLTVNGMDAIAFGRANVNTSSYTMVGGYGNNVNAYISFCYGANNDISGSRSYSVKGYHNVLGRNNIIEEFVSNGVILGSYNRISSFDTHDPDVLSFHNFIIGTDNNSKSEYSSTTIGKNNINDASLSFIYGSNSENTAAGTQKYSFGDKIYNDHNDNTFIFGTGKDFSIFGLQAAHPNSFNVGFGATKPALYVTGGEDGHGYDNTSQVGIGTSNPLGALSVNTENVNGVAIGSNSFVSSGAFSSGTDLAVQGNVGIGTIVPKNKLSIIGDDNERTVVIGNPSFDAGVGTDGKIDLCVQNSTLLGGNTFITSGFPPTPISNDFVLQVHNKACRLDGLTSWDIPSDERYKQNIEKFDDGLNKLKQINTIWFNYKDTFGLNSQNKRVGILSQEIQKILPYTVEENTIHLKKIVKEGFFKDSTILSSYKIQILDKIKGKDSTGSFALKDTIIEKKSIVKKYVKPEIFDEEAPLLTYNPTALTYVIINSIKDLDGLRVKDSITLSKNISNEIQNFNQKLNELNYQKQIDSLQVINNDLTIKIKDLEEKYENIKKCCESNKVDVYDDVLLDQNSPNPFDKTTTISYFIPERIKNPAIMMITDLNNSKIYFQFDLQNNIPSTITVDGTLLTTGVYNYSIIADGKVIKSKKMMVIK